MQCACYCKDHRRATCTYRPCIREQSFVPRISPGARCCRRRCPRSLTSSKCCRGCRIQSGQPLRRCQTGQGSACRPDGRWCGGAATMGSSDAAMVDAATGNTTMGNGRRVVASCLSTVSHAKEQQFESEGGGAPAAHCMSLAPQPAPRPCPPGRCARARAQVRVASSSRVPVVHASKKSGHVASYCIATHRKSHDVMNTETQHALCTPHSYGHRLHPHRRHGGRLH